MRKVLEHKGLELKVPADESWQLVVRMALAGTGALLGLSVDLLDDLHLGADEACNCLLNQKQKIEALEISCYRKENKVYAIFTGKRTEECQNIAEADVEIVEAILSTITVGVDIKHDVCGIWQIEVVLPIEEA